MSSQLSVPAVPATPGATDRIGSRLALLSFGHFLNDGSANYLPGILPAILIALHQPAAAAGSFMAALLIGQALQPLTGILSDRVGGRNVMIIGLLLSSLGGALLGFGHSVAVLVLFLLLIGVGNALYHPQALAIVRELVGHRKQGLSLSAFLVGGELGRGAFPVITSAIVVNLGLVWLWLMAIPTLVAIPFLRRYSPALTKRVGKAKPIDWRVSRGPMAYLVAFSSLRAFMTYGVVTYMPVLWHQRGGSLVVGAAIVTTVLVIGIIGNLSGGHLADRYGRRPMLIASSVLSALVLPLLTVTAGPLLWITAGLLGITLFAAGPTTVLIGQDIFPDNKSLGSGIALGLTNGIGALLVFASGAFVAGSGIEHILWAIAICGLIAAMLAVFMPKKMTDSHRAGVSHSS